MSIIFKLDSLKFSQLQRPGHKDVITVEVLFKNLFKVVLWNKKFDFKHFLKKKLIYAILELSKRGQIY